MRPRRRGVQAVLAALATLVLAGAGAAQEIAGRAVDAAGNPLPDVPIALHRVGGGSGATVATGVTDADGRFSFSVEAPDSAVYFVAIRHDDQMYIGPPARAGADRVSDYVVRADEGSEVGAITSALSGGGARPAAPVPRADRARTEGGAGAAAIALVTLLALAVAAVFVTTAPGYRRRQRRGLLIELARIENRLAAADHSDADRADADRADDRRRRESLRARLVPRT